MRRNWNPEAIVRFQTELLDWIEEQLDLLAKAPHGGRNGDTSAKLSVTDAAPPADPVAPPPPPTKTKRQKQPIA